MGLRGPPRLSDEEKKRRGTFRADRSEAAYAAKDSERFGSVVSGPWLNEIPEPEVPLGEFGRKKYHEYTRLLLDMGMLTTISREQAELAGVLHQEISNRINAGESVKAATTNQLRSVLRDLRLSENAKPIAGRRAASKFDGCGFANSPHPQVRLRRAPESHPRT